MASGSGETLRNHSLGYVAGDLLRCLSVMFIALALASCGGGGGSIVSNISLSVNEAPPKTDEAESKTDPSDKDAPPAAPVKVPKDNGAPTEPVKAPEDKAPPTVPTTAPKPDMPRPSGPP